MSNGQATDDELGRFFRLSLDLFAIVGFDGYLKRINPAWEATLGFSAEELLSRPLAEFAHPEDRGFLAAELQKLSADFPGELSFESRFRARDGSHRRLRWNAVASNRRQSIYAAARDVGGSDISATRRYRTLFESSNDGILIVDRKTGQALEVNPRMIDMFGYPERELVGAGLGDIEFLRANEFIRTLHQPLPPQESIRYECALRAKDGSLIDVELSYAVCKETDDGPSDIIQVNVRDISERKRAVTALRESEERFRLLVEGVRDYAVFMLDIAGRVVSWNTGAERILGFGEAEILGQSVAVMFTPEDRAARVPEREIERAISDGRSEDERWHMRKDGGRFLASEVLTSLWDESGRLRGFAKVMRDVTERRDTQQALLQAQKLESIGLLAGGIAHDFNNLLTGILGNASLARDHLSGSHPAYRMIEEVLASSRRAADLTRQLLAYAGKGRFVLEPVQISELVSDILDLIQTSIPKKVRLQLDLGRDLPLIEADPTQIQQIVMNLVVNAAEAIGDAEGTIRVSTGAQEMGAGETPAVTIGEVVRRIYVYLDISDNGPGIDQETRSKIFDPFFTTKFTGRGLGLAAVSGIVRGHKGAVLVQSSPGVGSAFRVFLPAAEAFSESHGTPPNESDLRGTGVVLVADDEVIVLRIAKAALERYGYGVELAENGEQAVRIFREKSHEIAVVLLDIAMPIVSGEDALRQIREIRSDVPVILSSGYSSLAASERFQRIANVAGFLQKPYTVSQLAEKIKSVIKRPDAAN